MKVIVISDECPKNVHADVEIYRRYGNFSCRAIFICSLLAVETIDSKQLKFELPNSLENYPYQAETFHSITSNKFIYINSSLRCCVYIIYKYTAT